MLDVTAGSLPPSIITVLQSRRARWFDGQKLKWRPLWGVLSGG